MDHKCGVIGLWANKKIRISKCIKSLQMLQHRGRESCGIAYINETNKIKDFKGIGQISHVFNDNELLELESNGIIGHVRYSTSGKSKDDINKAYDECQPITKSNFSLVHNGNIPHFKSLNINFKNISYEISNDTHLVVGFIDDKLKSEYIEFEKNLEKILLELLDTFQGAFNLIILTPKAIYAVRDKYGYRPLCIGKNPNSWIVASESVALVEHRFIRSVSPGEIIKIDNDGLTSVMNQLVNYKKCVFELIYFMNENSLIDNKMIYQFRYLCGQTLALQENKNNNNNILNLDTNNYIVIGSPNSGIPGGKGFADKLGLPYAQYLRKKPDCGRTFILPNQTERLKYLEKFDLDVDKLKGKNIILVDDSIVRGNTIKSLNRFLKEYAQVNELHVRVLSPPIKYPCYYGVDIPTSEELIINKMSIDDIVASTGIDSLIYIDINELKSILDSTYSTAYMSENFCYACFDGKYNNDIIHDF